MSAASAQRADLGLVAPRTGNAKALLREMHRLLAALCLGGVGGSIDLRALPLTPADLEELHTVLGTGAVDARVDALGDSTARETSFPGIWWITHYNEANEVVAELIEICTVPTMLVAPSEDIIDGVARFEQVLREQAEAKA